MDLSCLGVSVSTSGAAGPGVIFHPIAPVKRIRHPGEPCWIAGEVENVLRSIQFLPIRRGIPEGLQNVFPREGVNILLRAIKNPRHLIHGRPDREVS